MTKAIAPEAGDVRIPFNNTPHASRKIGAPWGVFFFITTIATSGVQELHVLDGIVGFSRPSSVGSVQKRAQLARSVLSGYIRSHDERCGHLWNAQ